MSREYLGSARRTLQAGELAPARFLTLHALELAVKAALAAAEGRAPRTHNVGGEFGRHYREAVGDAIAKRVNRLLAGYDGPRYPEWEVPAPDALADDLAFVESFVLDVMPALLRRKA